MCVEVQLLICSSVALFRLEFAAVSSGTQECCRGVCSARAVGSGSPPRDVCCSTPQVLPHSVPFCEQPDSKPIKYSSLVKIDKYSNDSLASAFP